SIARADEGLSSTSLSKDGKEVPPSISRTTEKASGSPVTTSRTRPVGEPRQASYRDGSPRRDTNYFEMARVNKSWMKVTDRLDPRYEKGVEELLDFTFHEDRRSFRHGDNGQLIKIL
ncbi:hypothetical protein Taro_049933, partial [Colocasia esculenta]|nr:hypothetical protein [Colocasia esculenta]